MDFFTMTIPNRISLALFAAFLCWGRWLGWDPGRWPHTLGRAVGPGVGVLLFIPGLIGGGDAK